VVEDPDNHTIVLAELAPVFGRPLALRSQAPDAARARATQDLKPAIDRAVAFFQGEIIERPRREERRPS
jgi:hypothetical protein